MTGVVFDIKEMTVHDGPGIRVTVFLKGCPLRCVWCHNPEGLSPKPELMVKTNGCLHCGLCRQPCGHPECAPYHRCLHVCPKGLISVCGTEMTAAEVAARVLPLKPFFETSGGGVTLSGGEVLMQPEFAEAVLSACKGVHRAIQTSGYAKEDVFLRVLTETDLTLFDIKQTDPEKHKKYTGVDSAPILRNLELLRESGKPFSLRVPLIPGYNDDAENLERIAVLAAKGGNLQSVDILKYNPYAGAKYAWVGRDYTAEVSGEKQVVPDLSAFTRRNLPVQIL